MVQERAFRPADQRGRADHFPARRNNQRPACLRSRPSPRAGHSRARGVSLYGDAGRRRFPRPRLQRVIYHQPFASGKIGFGYFEKYDLENVGRAVRQKDPQGTIGVLGASRVGATALQLAALREGSGDVVFYIIDAAFSDLRDLLRFHYRRDVGVPLDPLAYGYASLMNYLRDGYFFGDASPRRSIAGRADPCAVHPWPGRPGHPLPNDGRTLPG